MEKEVKNEIKANRNLAITFRVFQAIFFGMFALGISMILGEITNAIQLPISNFATTTTAFGLIGAGITGHLANKCRNW